MLSIEEQQSLARWSNCISHIISTRAVLGFNPFHARRVKWIEPEIPKMLQVASDLQHLRPYKAACALHRSDEYSFRLHALSFIVGEHISYLNKV